MLLLLSIVVFFAVLLAPAIPSMRELARPKDDGKLHVSERYVRDPRFFGRSFREKMATVVEQARATSNLETTQNWRTNEEVRFSPDLTVADGQRVRGVVAGDRVRIGARAQLRDAFAVEKLTVGSRAVLRTASSNGSISLLTGSRILRWVDSETSLDVAQNVELGMSAAATGAVQLSRGVKFERVWGEPVTTMNASNEPPRQFRNGPWKIIDASMIDGDKSLVLYGNYRIAAGTHVPAHIKIHGCLDFERDVTVDGNVIVRGDVRTERNVTIRGHVFSEGSIRFGPNTTVGTTLATKTVYTTGLIELANDVWVAGWIVAEKRGIVR